jgi:hypothetical protein
LTLVYIHEEEAEDRKRGLDFWVHIISKSDGDFVNLNECVRLMQVQIINWDNQQYKYYAVNIKSVVHQINQEDGCLLVHNVMYFRMGTYVPNWTALHLKKLLGLSS